VALQQEKFPLQSLILLLPVTAAVVERNLPTRLMVARDVVAQTQVEHTQP
jgi:hypothetical protein